MRLPLAVHPGEAVGVPGRAVADSVAVVTGAGSGTDRATVLRLAADGARVVACDVDEAGLVATRDAAVADGGDVPAVPADVSRTADVDALVAAAPARHGRLDALVTNAGVAGEEPFLEMTEAGLDAALGVNVKGVAFCGQAAARAMAAQDGGGKIVDVAGVAGGARAGIAAYSASKAAVAMLTRSMALELGPRGIRVDAVAPGVIRSGMNPLRDPGRNRELETAIPLGHIGRPAHVAGVIRFLLSPDADHVSGETVVVDGGWWSDNDPPRRP